jgi:hypothetical protein
MLFMRFRGLGRGEKQMNYGVAYKLHAESQTYWSEYVATDEAHAKRQAEDAGLFRDGRFFAFVFALDAEAA